MQQSLEVDKRRRLLCSLAVLTVGVVNLVWHLGTPTDWWFEDDPYVYGAIRGVASPWLFFYDVASNRLATGPNEMAPVLLSSLWLDLWLAPRSTAWAYVHSGLVYLATSVAFYLVMLRLLPGRWMPLATTLAWMLLPSTIVLVEFISTRHYMIGLFWALLAALAVDDALKARPGKRGFLLVKVAAFTWLSIISKEFFPPAVLTMTFLWFAWKRDWRGAAIPVALGAAYAIYRLHMTEPALVYYGNALMSPVQVARLLLRLPYMTYGGWAGYIALAATIVLLRRKAKVDPKILPMIAIGSATMFVSLLVIYPVGNAVSVSWRSFGTWYRTPCVINTLLLVAFSYAVCMVREVHKRAAMMALLVMAVMYGAHRTASQWDRMKADQAAEAEFMFANPDKTLVSQARAVWFLRGVASLYLDREHAPFVNRWDRPQTETYKALITSSAPFWTLQGGKVQEGTAAIREQLAAELR